MDGKAGYPLVPAMALLAVALAATAGAESHSWDTADDFSGGVWEDTMWNPVDNAVMIDWESTWGKHWQNPVLEEGTTGTYDETTVDEPHLLYAQQRYHLYYTAVNASGAYSIGHAVSTDGLVYTKDSSSVLSNGTSGDFDEGIVRDPHVIYEGGTFRMWYAAKKTTNDWSIGYATSPDGTTWTKRSTPVLTGPTSGWGDQYIRGPCVIRVDGQLWMYLDGNKEGTNRATIGRAYSTDDVTFTLASGNPILDFAPAGEVGAQRVLDPMVFRYNLGYQMLFSGSVTSGAATMRIARAFSEDGLSWTHDVGWVFGTGEVNAWDDHYVQAPSVLDEGDVLRMAFVGHDGSANYAIGIAEYKRWIVRGPNNPVMTNGTGYIYGIYDPMIGFKADGEYWLFFAGVNETGYSSIQRMTSTSPLDWSSRKYRVISEGSGEDWDRGNIRRPCAVHCGLLYSHPYLIYYEGEVVWSRIGGSDHSQKFNINPIITNGTWDSWNSYEVNKPWVLRTGTKFLMWYGGLSSHFESSFGFASSIDGYTWSENSKNPVLTFVGLDWATSVTYPSVVYHNGRYTMLYLGDVHGIGRIGMAESLDGTNWTHLENGPFLFPSRTPSLNEYDIHSISTFLEGSDVYVMYSSNVTGNTTHQFCYAMLSTTVGTYTTPVLDASGLYPVEWQTLSWDADTPPGTEVRFQVAVNDGGDVWKFIGPSGTGSTYFETPGEALPFLSGRYMRVRAYMGTENGSISAPTLRSITVSYRQRPGPSPPVVELTSPNGGEDWMKTKQYPITWTMRGNLETNRVSLSYSTNNGSTWNLIALIIDGKNYFRWTVPSVMTSGALVQVTVYDMDGASASDTSDATFAIDPPPPKSGHFLTPAPGDRLGTGTREVRWAIFDPWGLAEAPLTLEFTPDGGVTWTTLQDGLALTDGVEWEVPSLAESSARCRLRLRVLDWLGSVSLIESGEFTVDVTAPTVTLEPPGAGAVTLRAVAWDDVGVTGVTAHVGDGEHAMAPGANGTWTLELELSPGDEVRVTATDGVHEVSTEAAAVEADEGGEAPGLAVATVIACLAVVAVIYRRRR